MLKIKRRNPQSFTAENHKEENRHCFVLKTLKIQYPYSKSAECIRKITFFYLTKILFLKPKSFYGFHQSVDADFSNTYQRGGFGVLDIFVGGQIVN